MSKFNTRYTHGVLKDVHAERLRTVEAGQQGRVPHACEAPRTDWGYRLGVLGEEFGEVCTEWIECEVNATPGGRMYDELIQVAAVATACAESIIAGMSQYEAAFPDMGSTTATADSISFGVDSDMDPPEAPMSQGERDTMEVGFGVREHEQVLLRALAIYKERNAGYRDRWKDYGWRGSLFQVRIRAERAWTTLWNASGDSLNTDPDKKINDLIDLINYAVFTIRNIEVGNRDGSWEWPGD